MSAQLRLAAAGAVATAATALSLHTVFAGWHWLGPVLGTIVLVMGTTAAARAARLPAVLQPIAAGVVILLWITFLDARSVAVDGVFPGPSAFRALRDVTRNGINDVHQLATPVPTHRGVVLLAVLGVAAVALVVDLMVVQLRRVALAGLPLLGLFATCAGVGRHGAGVIAFVVSAAGFLWLLFVDSRERVTRWGTSVSAGVSQRRRGIWADVGSDPSPSDTATALGRRIGGAAIGLGVIVPLLLPGLHTGIGHRHGGHGGSGGDIVTVNPIVSIASDLQEQTARPLLTYRSSAADPGYLRLTSLANFSGNSFSASTLVASSENAKVDGPVPGVAPPVATTADPSQTTAVTISKTLGVHWLPVESQVATVALPQSSNWLYDTPSGTIFSASSSTSGLQYTTTSVPVDPSPTQLAAAGAPAAALAPDMTVPSDLSPAVRQLTHQVTKQAKTPYAEALAIQDFLTKGHRFVYDTTIPANTSANGLADFLLSSRRGFCQQFSTAMAVMARIVGIPSRVAVGFTRGTLQPNGSWLVTSADAHAWPELWFQGVGWVPFEPTPRGDGQAVTPAYAQGTASQVTNPSGGGADGPRHNALQNTKPLGPAARRGAIGTGGTTTASATSGGGDSTALWPLVVLLVVAVLLAPWAVRRLGRRQRRHRMNDPAMAAQAAWAELRAVSLDLHAPWDDDRSPRQAAAGVARVVAGNRAAADALAQVALAEESSRYARNPQPVGPTLWADVDTVARALRDRLRPVNRLRFRLFPRSLLLAVRPVVWRAADALNGLDGWLGRSWRKRPHHGPGPRTSGEA
ncbi:MAG TPA: DUF3488 and transglutaminase-like domain-containing protein [Mycobacteriales bacterium]|nr:DUF3488 and transglutaminase-like domain-containing protein [Mycobacteriales bacterium]